MKSIFSYGLMVVLLILVFACSNNKDLYDPEETVTTANANFEKFNTKTSLTVTAPAANTVKIVRIGSDTLCVTSVGTDVLVPKGCTPTVEEVTTSATSRAANYLTDTGKHSFWEVIAFEDTKNGDYDYNDLIVHPKYVLNTNNHNFSLYIHPVAYGATKTIDLYYEVYDKNNTLITKGSILNTRKNLFFDSSNSFINTSKYDRHYSGFTYKDENKATNSSVVKSLNDIYINWYIVVNGDTSNPIYALNKNLISSERMMDTNGYPYALVLSGVNAKGYQQTGVPKGVGHDWFRYPKETIDIRSCYDMEAWMNSGGKPLEEDENGNMPYVKDLSKTFDVTTTDISTKRIYELKIGFDLVSSWDTGAVNW